MNRLEVHGHIEAIEKSYEFFLAYAAQGARDDEASKVGTQLREFLGQMSGALAALENELGALMDDQSLAPAEPYRDMIALTSHDAGKAGVGVRLVLAQVTISSELIDNLNASLHLRTLLTDLFLLDEVL